MKRYLWISVFVLALIVLAIAYAADTPPSTLPPVDQRKACLECHDDMAALFLKADVHKPLEEGKCSSCHNPHASRHMRMLDDDMIGLCSRCHNQIEGWTSQLSVHQPVREGKCVECHNPHASDNQRLLKKNRPELCITCHTQVKDWQARAYPHEPVQKGQCSRCHDAHSAANPGLLRKDQASLCLGCHDATPEFSAKHRGFNPQTATCTACHDPHGSSSPSLLMREQHPPFASGECSVCHVATANAAGYPLKESRQQVCGQCHSAEVETVMRFQAHGSNSESSCEKCHNPHASHEKNLLASTQATLCVKCHDPRQGVEVPYVSPHSALQCATCHQPHGTTNASYLKKPPLELCAQCHSREHHVAHPMGEGTISPISGNPVDCVSCHSLHQYKFKPLLPADRERDLCVRCHREK